MDEYYSETARKLFQAGHKVGVTFFKVNFIFILGTPEGTRFRSRRRCGRRAETGSRVDGFRPFRDGYQSFPNLTPKFRRT